ncbi:MAG: hypothetical protein LBU65_01620 [Planctomycetaceae bacterium]|jgi:hypothetical protein|nr:hypothetical protein [Planctomycetaceae bacterium]
MLLDREEYIEQSFFFETFLERLESGVATQEILATIRSELLTTTQLPNAVDFLLTDMKLTGVLSTAMRRISHYFTPFQAFVIGETENDTGRFDFRIALSILQREAKYRSENLSVQGIFFYQFETICRNRLGYDTGLKAIAGDPIYNEDWREWMQVLNRQIGYVDLADMIFVRSSLYEKKTEEMEIPTLFGEREGRIAKASRKRDPVHLFAALSRHLGYPSVPRQKRATDTENTLPVLQRRIDQLESRLNLMEEEQRGGLNLAPFIVGENKH